jgi:hypothetical protein
MRYDFLASPNVGRAPMALYQVFKVEQNHCKKIYRATRAANRTKFEIRISKSKTNWQPNNLKSRKFANPEADLGSSKIFSVLKCFDYLNWFRIFRISSFCHSWRETL